MLCHTAPVLILVRHGRTPANAAGLLQGRLDQDLDEIGRLQAIAIAAFVRSRCEIDAVISSPLKRAVETAAAFGQPAEIDERWQELSYGEFEGVPQRDVPPEVWQHWRGDRGFTPEGGESLAALDVRVRRACEDVTERASHGNVVVVSHVSPIKSAVAWALDVDNGISWNSHLDQASICQVRFRGRRPILASFNETVPIAPEASR